MIMVLTKISSATSGLNEAFTSLLKGFEVCSEKCTIFWFEITRYVCSLWIVAPETLVARHRWQTGDHILMSAPYMCADIQGSDSRPVY